MKRLVTSLILTGGIFAAVAAAAQTRERPTHIPTPQAKDSPFGTEWAKPPGTTGSYIYNDPRRYDPKNPSVSGKTCPAPTLYDPAAGRCK